MSSTGSYFVLNKDSDFLQGYGYNIRYLNPGITIESAELKYGWYITKVFDSREKKTVWQRLLTEGSTLSEASVSVYLYSSDNEFIDINNVRNHINDVIKDEDRTAEEKLQLFQIDLKMKVTDPKDVLLHQISGKYFWMAIHLKMQGENNPEITKIKVIFPKKTLMNFLPDVYQENKKSSSFLERYLEIFDTLYEDVNYKIERISEYFDPDSTPAEFLGWLSEWLSIEDSYLWNERQLRYLLKNMMRLYRIRGTKQYLEEMIELYTGVRPYIVENHQIEAYMGDTVMADRLKNLYGDSKYVFTVIVNIGKQASSRSYQILTKIINNAKPANMGCRLIVLEPYIYLDKHSYLGINSLLGNYTIPILDSTNAMTFVKLENSKNMEDK